jgi:hypothetical protein
MPQKFGNVLPHFGGLIPVRRDVMQFRIPEHILVALRESQSDRAGNPVLLEHDAFVLYSGFGTLLILTTDGRVLEDGTYWDGTPVREATDEGAIEAIVIGAKTTGLSVLLDLLPNRPESAINCPQCWGHRFAPPNVENLPSELRRQFAGFVCTSCHGLGWV